MAELKVELRVVTVNIETVEALLSMASSDAEIAYLREKERLLGEKERELREEKIILIDEELPDDIFSLKNIHFNIISSPYSSCDRINISLYYIDK